MRTRKPITEEQILAALYTSDGDVKAAAKALEVSDRTLYRRMADYGIRGVRTPVRYAPSKEAA